MAGLTREQAQNWIDLHPDAVGSERHNTVLRALQELSAEPAAPAAPPGTRPAGAGETISVNPQMPVPGATDPGAPRPPTSDSRGMITVNQPNYRAPIGEVRDTIGRMPEPDRPGAWNQWGDVQERDRVANLGTLGTVGNTVEDGIRMIAQGVPGGSFLDEMNAGTAAAMPEWLGGMPYTEAKALQDARDRRLRTDMPYQNVGGNITGAVLSAPATALRGAGVAANVGVDTLLGALQGLGEGNTLSERLHEAGKSMGLTAAMSYPLRTLNKVYGQYSHTTDAIDKAAEQLGIKLPFFARAEDKSVQAAGRQQVQRNPDSSIGQAWNEGLDTTRRAGSDTAERVVGAPADTAPYVAGQQVKAGMERASEGIGTQMGALANETTQLMPTGEIFRMPATRQSLGNVVEDRLASRMENPQQGLQDTYNATSGPISWRGASEYVTRLGERLRAPQTSESTLSRADMERLYAPARDVDQPAMVNQALGPAGEARFRANVDSQRELADLRRTLNTAIGNNKQPEQLIALAHTAATVKGGGTRLNQLQAITQGMTAEERQLLGGGVIAKIHNDAGGSPLVVAQKLRDIPDVAKDVLFPQGTRLRADIDALGPLAQRVGQVEARQAVGSAKTFDFGKLAGTGAGTLSAGYLANKYNLGTEFATLLATLAAGKTAAAIPKPFLLEKGLPQGYDASVNAATGGLARGIGQQW